MEYEIVIRKKSTVLGTFTLNIFQEDPAVADPGDKIADDHFPDHRVERYFEFITLFHKPHLDQVI